MVIGRRKTLMIGRTRRARRRARKGDRPVYYQPDIETMPREQLRELQLERMRQSIRHAYDNVAFYQRTFKEAGVTPDDLTSLEDLTRFPFVVKQDMRDAYPFGLFAVPQKDVARIHASSGTTGQATVVGHTKNDLANWGDVLRPRHRHGGWRRELHHPGVLRLRPVHGRPRSARRRRGHGLLGHPRLLGQHEAPGADDEGPAAPTSSPARRPTRSSSRTRPSRWAMTRPPSSRSPAASSAPSRPPTTCATRSATSSASSIATCTACPRSWVPAWPWSAPPRRPARRRGPLLCEMLDPDTLQPVPDGTSGASRLHRRSPASAARSCATARAT